MNKHTKLLVSLLFVFLIILAAAITRFYSAVPDETLTGGTQAEIVRKLESDSAGNRIFEDGSGLCGVLDSRERVAVAPEWLELSFAGENRCIASKRIGGRILSGCIDYEGNIVVPFIYSEITRHSGGGAQFYIAEADADGQFVVYSDSFVPMFRQSWSGAEFSGGELTLVDAGGIYTYTFSEEGELVFDRAKVSGETMGSSFTMEVSSRILLGRLTPPMLEEIAADVGAYLEFAYTGNDDLLSELTTGSRGGFQTLFPDDHKILEKELKGVPEIFMYSLRSEDGVPRYAVSVTADTVLTYSDENDGETKNLRDDYTAVVEFAGTNVSSLTAQSGSFLLNEPDYPQPEPEVQYDPVTGEPIVPGMPEPSSEETPVTTAASGRSRSRDTARADGI